MYLRESLSNYTDDYHDCQRIYQKLHEKEYETEEDFVRELDENELEILNAILKKEIDYAKDEQDEKRTHELNEVYELLF